MSFLRPEAAAAIVRWREVITGTAALGLGLWGVLTSFGALFLIGCGFVAVGTALTAAGVQRGRFRRGGGGSGVVDIDERRITYLGPFGGGGVAVEDLVELAVDPSGSWLMRDLHGQHLMIPMNAEGADALFDAFSALPGLSGARVVEASRGDVPALTVIWTKPQGRSH